MAAADTEVLDGIEPLIERYDAFLLDQYGVLHDGLRPFPGVLEALELLRRADRTVVLLSNSGRRSVQNCQRLTRLGIPPELYTRMVTSGEAAWLGLRERRDPAFADLGRRCLLFSTGGDRSPIDGLDLETTDDAETADFVFLAGLDPDPAVRDACARGLERALARRLPLLCTNPDLVSLVGERHIEGPGAVAASYAEAEGDVRFVGKPWPAIYRIALQGIEVAPARIVAVGDSLDHDIAGAAAFGIAGALVTAGVHRDAFAGRTSPAAMIAALGRLGGPRPRYLLPTLARGTG